MRGGNRTVATIVARLLLTLVALVSIWSVSPARAALLPGCTCPAGATPLSGTTCLIATVPVAAICPGLTAQTAQTSHIAQIAASQQQLSFWGINMMLQQRRDQLQGTPRTSATTPNSPGRSSADLGTGSDALGYSDQDQKTDPPGPLFNKAPPAPEPAPENPMWGTWVQGLGDWEHDGALSSTDNAHFTATYSVQGGIDRTWQNVMSSGDAFVLGLVSSYASSHITTDNTPTTQQLVGPGVGLYGQYVNGGFSTDLTTKFDFLRMDQDFAGLAPNVGVDITNAGLSGNMQYKLTGMGNSFLEPTVGFSFTRTIFGSGASTLNLQDASTVRLQAGARIGATWDAGGGVSVDSNLKALVYDNVIAQGSTAAGAALLASPITPTGEGLIRGELDPEICFNLTDGYSVSVSGSLRFGEALIGGSAGINLRKQW